MPFFDSAQDKILVIAGHLQTLSQLQLLANNRHNTFGVTKPPTPWNVQKVTQIKCPLQSQSLPIQSSSQSPKGCFKHRYLQRRQNPKASSLLNASQPLYVCWYQSINTKNSRIQHRFSRKCCYFNTPNPRTSISLEKTYRVQKNGNNGATELLTRNTARPHLCPFKHWLTIIDRFHRLVSESVTNRPLAVYKDNRNGKVLNICSNDSKKTMQMVVKLKYRHTNQKNVNW